MKTHSYNPSGSSICYVRCRHGALPSRGEPLGSTALICSLQWPQHPSAHKLAVLVSAYRHPVRPPHLLPALLLLTSLKSTMFQAPLRSLPRPLLSTNGLSSIYCLSINSLYRTHVSYTFPLTPDLSNGVHGWNMTLGW